MGQMCLLTDAATKTVYVRDSGPDGKIVQLIPWRDQILALDSNGSILLIDSSYNPASPTVSLWMEEPRIRK